VVALVERVELAAVLAELVGRVGLVVRAVVVVVRAAMG
jgi:hypothetical protein